MRIQKDEETTAAAAAATKGKIPINSGSDSFASWKSEQIMKWKQCGGRVRDKESDVLIGLRIYMHIYFALSLFSHSPSLTFFRSCSIQIGWNSMRT